MGIRFFKSLLVLCFLLMSVAKAQAQEESGSAVLENNDPAYQINPEHFKLLLVITVCLTIVGGVWLVIRNLKKEKKKRSDIISQIQKAYKSGDILETDHEDLKKGLNPIKYDWLVKRLSQAMINKSRYDYLHSKYPKEMATDLFEYKHWIGMTLEQLIDSRGHAYKTENEILKTRTIKMYFYKTAKGEEIFNFVEGILEKVDTK